MNTLHNYKNLDQSGKFTLSALALERILISAGVQTLPRMKMQARNHQLEMANFEKDL